MLGFGQIPGLNEESVFWTLRAKELTHLFCGFPHVQLPFTLPKNFPPINILVPLRGPERKHLESAQQLEGGSVGSHTAPLRSNTLSDMSEALGQKIFLKDFF